MAYQKPRKIKVFYDDQNSKSEIWPKATATGREIKEKFAIAASKMVVLKKAKGSRILKDNDVVELSEQGISLTVQPNVVQGGFFSWPGANRLQALDRFDYRRNRKARYLVSQLLEYGEEKFRREKLTIRVTRDLKYVYVPDYPFPAMWRQRRAPILVHIPESYPDVPPLGFYIPHGTCLKNGDKHSHQFCQTYYSQPDLHNQGWDWFCLHLVDKSDWLPKDDPLKPHKFWNYMDIVRLGLSNHEIRM